MAAACRCPRAGRTRARRRPRRPGPPTPTRLVSGRPMLPTTSTGRCRRVEHRAEQRCRRRLAVRARDPEDRVGEQARAELDLGDDRDSPGAGGLHRRCLGGHAGALDDEVRLRRGMRRARRRGVSHRRSPRRLSRDLRRRRRQRCPTPGAPSRQRGRSAPARRQGPARGSAPSAKPRRQASACRPGSAARALRPTPLSPAGRSRSR